MNDAAPAAEIAEAGDVDDDEEPEDVPALDDVDNDLAEVLVIEDEE